MGFAKLSGGVVPHEPLNTPNFQQEELLDTRPYTQGRINDMADLGNFFDKDMTFNEAHLRKSFTSLPNKWTTSINQYTSSKMSIADSKFRV